MEVKFKFSLNFQVQEAIKKRKFEHETSGTALTAGFLTEMERQYKNKYLRDIATHAELLVYDWSGGGEVEVVSIHRHVNGTIPPHYSQTIATPVSQNQQWRPPEKGRENKGRRSSGE